MTEKDVFLAYAEMRGFDIRQNEKGRFENQRVDDMFTGWLARADIQKAAESRNAAMMLRDIESRIGKVNKP